MFRNERGHQNPRIVKRSHSIKIRSNNLESEIYTFLELVSEEKFSLSNVAISLFIDVVKWFSKSDTCNVHYSDTSLELFWHGKTIFGSRFRRFMGRPINETLRHVRPGRCVVSLSKRHLLPKSTGNTQE